MFINNSAVLCKIKDIDMLINLKNGSVVGLNEKGLNFYYTLESKNISTITDKDLQNLFKFLLDNNFISYTPFAKEEKKISTAYVHLTNKCNLHCIGCYSLDENRNVSPDLSYSDICKVLKDLKDVGVNNLIFSGGEPLCRNDLVDIVKYARINCNIPSITLITNGTISKLETFEELSKYIDVVAVSIDTYSEQCSPFIRDPDIFKKVIDTINKLKDSNAIVSILPTLHALNANKMERYLQLSKELNVGISFSILSTCENEEFKNFILSQNDLLNISNHFLNYGVTLNDAPINNTLEGKNYCGAGQTMIAVGSTGNIYPCHMLMTEEFCMGNIKDNTIRNILDESSLSKEISKYEVNQFENCNKCNFKYLCGGGCRARAFMSKHNLKKQDPYCTLFKNYYNQLMDRIVTKINT